MSACKLHSEYSCRLCMLVANPVLSDKERIAALEQERDEWQEAYANQRQIIEDEQRPRIAALEAEVERLRGLLIDIRNDIQCAHWHRDIDAALAAIDVVK